ncbi:SDR family oxidoreductase [Fervidibacillus halotolerans]|uniref:SDR family oxidoreductase n=1 Tax=Fervidibacillus halotolerans TaxID=2980027 RepID=A0A9E8M252_9BACI|nr:SDR family oxidoreductase [Fervidibacillus halotolerans]WAA13836.1 SDR family oxidoreductase [Fervidibacillus halotolerans]
MTPVYFFTGFPGFVANQIIVGLLEKGMEFKRMYVLVLPSLKEQAEAIRGEWMEKYGLLEDRFQILSGDITERDLGLERETVKELQGSVSHVFHLAAIYDLAVPKDVAYRVNVIGTKNMNQFVLNLSELQRYVYFSTAYVAGKREGILREDELVRPPSFKNYYEETKFEAEILVKDVMEKRPVTIIRPGIIKGHSKTGETSKFDGPYLFLNAIYRLKHAPFFPKVGKLNGKVNLVPIDFIVDAVIYLSHEKKGEKKTYHLTDPNPYTAEELYEMMLKEMLGRSPKGRIPLSLVNFLLSFPSIRRTLHVEKEITDYFIWQGTFDSTIAQRDLLEGGISCPDLKEQLPSMIDFYLRHREDQRFHIKIR